MPAEPLTKELRLAKKRGGKVWRFVADDGRTLCAMGNRGGEIEIVPMPIRARLCKRCEKVADRWLAELSLKEESRDAQT